MSIRVFGDISRLDAKFRNTIRELEEATKKNTGLNLQIALNYGSRDEMIRAIKKMVKDHDAGKLATEDITEECFSSYLDTKEIPDPDLLIRTSVCRIICFGSLHTVNFILHRFRGRIFQKRN